MWKVLRISHIFAPLPNCYSWKHRMRLMRLLNKINWRWFNKNKLVWKTEMMLTEMECPYCNWQNAQNYFKFFLLQPLLRSFKSVSYFGTRPKIKIPISEKGKNLTSVYNLWIFNKIQWLSLSCQKWILAARQYQNSKNKQFQIFKVETHISYESLVEKTQNEIYCD